MFAVCIIVEFFTFELISYVVNNLAPEVMRRKYVAEKIALMNVFCRPTSPRTHSGVNGSAMTASVVSLKGILQSVRGSQC